MQDEIKLYEHMLPVKWTRHDELKQELVRHCEEIAADQQTLAHLHSRRHKLLLKRKREGMEQEVAKLEAEKNKRLKEVAAEYEQKCKRVRDSFK